MFLTAKIICFQQLMMLLKDITFRLQDLALLQDALGQGATASCPTLQVHHCREGWVFDSHCKCAFLAECASCFQFPADFTRSWQTHVPIWTNIGVHDCRWCLHFLNHMAGLRSRSFLQHRLRLNDFIFTRWGFFVLHDRFLPLSSFYWCSFTHGSSLCCPISGCLTALFTGSSHHRRGVLMLHGRCFLQHSFFVLPSCRADLLGTIGVIIDDFPAVCMIAGEVLATQGEELESMFHVVRGIFKVGIIYGGADSARRLSQPNSESAGTYLILKCDLVLRCEECPSKSFCYLLWNTDRAKRKSWSKSQL